MHPLSAARGFVGTNVLHSLTDPLAALGHRWSDPDTIDRLFVIK